MVQKRGFRVSVLLSLLLLLLAFGCETQEGQTVSLTPFAGGTEGVTIAFDQFPTEVYDGGTDEFPLFVKIENIGERDVSPEDMIVRLIGFNDFDTPKGVQQNPDEKLPGIVKDSVGNIVPSFPVYLEFLANYRREAPPGTNKLSVSANACYKYGTDAVTKLCVRRNLQSPEEGGICNVNEAKPSFSSGAPVQITNTKELPFGSSKINLQFDVVHTGSGIVYQLGEQCGADPRMKNRILLRVDTGIDGTTCSPMRNLQRDGTAVTGEITLREGGVSAISCTIPVTKSDYEFLVEINAEYTYGSSTGNLELPLKQST
jgi:hypothetical protein